MSGSAFPGTSGWLLLADDSGPLRAMLRRALTGADVLCDIVEACDTDEALLRLAEREAPELIVLDVNMPGRSGLDILPEVRACCPQTFITVLTGLSAAEVGQLCLDGGADLYLPKDNGLTSCVQQLLHEWRAHRGADADIPDTDLEAGRTA